MATADGTTLLQFRWPATLQLLPSMMLFPKPHTIASRPELRKMSASFALNAVASQCLQEGQDTQ
jgi:hypothetical protein